MKRHRELIPETRWSITKKRSVMFSKDDVDSQAR